MNLIDIWNILTKQGVICLQVLAVGKEASEAYSKGQRVLFTDLHTQEVGISQQPFPFGVISMLPLQSARMTVLCNGEVSLYPLVVSKILHYVS